MANLTATSSFDAVLQLETTHQAIGGAGGTMNLQAQALTNRTQYLLDQVNTKTTLTEVKSNLNVTGSAPMYVARTWVNFNGTGTVAILASGNVTSVTDNAVGEYTVNFTTAMPDATYAMSGVCANNGSFGAVTVQVAVTATTRIKTASSVKIHTKNDQGSSTDVDDVSVIIFR